MEHPTTGTSLHCSGNPGILQGHHEHGGTVNLATTNDGHRPVLDDDHDDNQSGEEDINDVGDDDANVDANEGEEEEDESLSCAWIVVDEDAKSHVSQLTAGSCSIHLKRRTTRKSRKTNTRKVVKDSRTKKESQTHNGGGNNNSKKKNKNGIETENEEQRKKHDSATGPACNSKRKQGKNNIKSKEKVSRKECQKQNQQFQEPPEDSPTTELKVKPPPHLCQRAPIIEHAMTVNLRRSFSDSALQNKQQHPPWLLSQRVLWAVIPDSSKPNQDDPTSALPTVPQPTWLLAPTPVQQGQQQPLPIVSTSDRGMSSSPKRKKSQIKKSSRHSTKKTKPLSCSDLNSKLTPQSPAAPPRSLPLLETTTRKINSKLVRKSNKDRLLPLEQEMDHQNETCKEENVREKPQRKKRTKSLVVSQEVDSPNTLVHKSMVVPTSSNMPRQEKDEALQPTAEKKVKRSASKTHYVSKPRSQKKKSLVKPSKNRKEFVGRTESNLLVVVSTADDETPTNQDSGQKQTQQQPKRAAKSQSVSALRPRSRSALQGKGNRESKTTAEALLDDASSPLSLKMTKLHGEGTFASSLPQSFNDGPLLQPLPSTGNRHDALIESESNGLEPTKNTPSKKKGKNLVKRLRTRVLQFIVMNRGVFRSKQSGSSSNDKTIHTNNDDTMTTYNDNLEPTTDHSHGSRASEQSSLLLDNSLSAIPEDGARQRHHCPQQPQREPQPQQQRNIPVQPKSSNNRKMMRTLSLNTGHLLLSGKQHGSTPTSSPKKARSFRLARRPNE